MAQRRAPCLEADHRPGGWRLVMGTQPGRMAARTQRSPLVGAPGLAGAWIDRLLVREGGMQMGKLMKRAEKFARSPKAKTLEKKMLRKAEDPKTREKISKRFAKFRKKA